MIYDKAKLNDLADELISKIKKRNNFFEPYTIVVPNMKMAQYFKAYWLKKENDVLMNIRFKTFNEALQNTSKCRLINKDILKLLILDSINDIGKLEAEDDKKYCEFKKYIEDDIRLYDLSDKLASLFIEYIDDRFVISDGWQKALFNIVIDKANDKNYKKIDDLYFGKETSEICFFGFSEFTNAQIEIIKKIENKTDIYFLKKNEERNAEVFAAPSKLREIEIVHSTICKILNDKEETKYSDFLILAPKMEEYATTIKRVFEQDNEKFPSLPYCCCCINTDNNNALFVLNKLVEISNKRYFTRYDFFEIVNNELTKTIRNINAEEINEWMKAIVEMNIYRQNDFFDCWQYAKKRLLLSKIVEVNDVDENIVSLSKDGDYIPYKGISMGNESIVKFIKIVDNLKSWISFADSNPYLDKSGFSELIENLRLWLSKENVSEENSCFRKICKLFDSCQNFVDNKLSFSILMSLIIDEIKKGGMNQSKIFTNGITFTDFDEKCILSAKYIFLIGANLNILPKKEVESELDLRAKNDKDKLNPLYLQLQNAEDKFYISYINRDLESDAALYPSSFIVDLKIDKEKIKEYSIDNGLKWEDLFTIREYRNKTHYEGLFKDDKTNGKAKQKFELEQIKKVKLSSLAKFLKEPLSQKSRMIFSKDYDNDENILDEYEAFDLNKFDRHDIKISIILEMLNGVDCKEKILKKLKLENKLPNFHDGYDLDIYEQIYVDCENMFKDVFENRGFKLIKIADLMINNSWVLVCDKEMFREINNNEYTYVEMPYSDKKSDKLSRAMNLYLFSLMDIASLNSNVDYSINIQYGCDLIDSDIKINSAQAKEYLQRIFETLIDFKNNFVLPSNIIEEVDKGKHFTLEKFIEKLSYDNDWKFFNSKNMFDYYTQLGYSKENFEEKFDENIDLFKELLKPLL